MFSNFNFCATEKQKERSNDVGEKWRSKATATAHLHFAKLPKCFVAFVL